MNEVSQQASVYVSFLLYLVPFSAEQTVLIQDSTLIWHTVSLFLVHSKLAGYELAGLRFPLRAETFLFATTSRPAQGPTHPPTHRGPGILSSCFQGIMLMHRDKFLLYVFQNKQWRELWMYFWTHVAGKRFRGSNPRSSEYKDVTQSLILEIYVETTWESKLRDLRGHRDTWREEREDKGRSDGGTRKSFSPRNISYSILTGHSDRDEQSYCKVHSSFPKCFGLTERK